MDGRNEVIGIGGAGARSARATRRLLAVSAGRWLAIGIAASVVVVGSRVTRAVTFVRGSATAKHAHGG